MINAKDLIGKNIAVVGLPKTGKTELISKLVKDLKSLDCSKDYEFIVLSGDNKITTDKQTLVFRIKDKYNEGMYGYVENELSIRSISQFTGGELHKNNLIIIFDHDMRLVPKERLRQLINKINKLDNTNYIISAYSSDNAYKGIDISLQAEETAVEMVSIKAVH